MLAFSPNPVQTRCVMQCELNITVTPVYYHDGADLDINGKLYLLHPNDIKTEQDLRNLLASEPDYIVEAVIGMLKEMAQ